MVSEALTLVGAQAALFVTVSKTGERLVLAEAWADTMDRRECESLLGVRVVAAGDRECSMARLCLRSAKVIQSPGSMLLCLCKSLHSEWHAIEVLISARQVNAQDAAPLLGYLAQQVGLALENAALHAETEQQGAQLRRYLDEIIAAEERERVASWLSICTMALCSRSWLPTSTSSQRRCGEDETLASKSERFDRASPFCGRLSWILGG